MTQQIINLGAAPNDGDGDNLRTAFDKVNDNFSNVWTAGPVGSNVQISGNTISTLQVNQDLALSPNGTGNIRLNNNAIPGANNTWFLGSTTNQWRGVYANSITAGNVTINDNLVVPGDVTIEGNLTVEGDTIQIGNIVTDTKTIQLSNTASTANAATGSGITVGANDNIATLLYNSASNVWTTNIGITATGNVTAPYFFGNGSQLTGLPVQYGNSNVTTLLSNLGSNIISGTGNITTTGNITAGYFIGNGSLLTGITSYANANAVAYGESGWAGNIVPSGNAVYSLGNATNQWNDLYVSNATIFMNNVPISLSAGNVLTVNGNAVLQNNSNSTISTSGNITAGNVSATGNITGNYIFGNGSQLTGITANTGNVTFSNQIVLGTGTNDGSGGLYLAPGTDSIANSAVQYLRVRGGDAPTHIHLDTGNNAYYDQYFGDDNKYVKLANTGNVVINTNDYAGNTAQWNFGTDGSLTLPGANVDYTIATQSGYITVGNLLIGQGGSLFNSNNDSWALYGNISDPGTSISIPSDAAAGNGTPLYLENQISNVEIRSGSGTWNFDSTGNLTVPATNSVPARISTQTTLASEKGFDLRITAGNTNGCTVPGGDMYLSAGVGYNGISHGAGNVNIVTGDRYGNVTGNIWRFDSSGALTLPLGSATIKNTAGNAVAFGLNAGLTSQGANAVAIGINSGVYSQSASAVAIGALAGNGGRVSTNYVSGAVSPSTTLVVTSTTGIVPGMIITGTGFFGNITVVTVTNSTTLEISASAVFTPSGALNFTGSQGDNSIAIGTQAGQVQQGQFAVAIGDNAGNSGQGTDAVAIGASAGLTTQGAGAVALGQGTGEISQGNNAVALGKAAGQVNQGINSIAIGQSAGLTNQGNNSIILNATGSALEQTTANTFTVAPVRNDVANVGNVLFYNTTSKEITYGNTISVTGNITGNYILGNGSQLTSINAVTVDITDTNGLTTVYYPTFVENRTTAQIARADVDLTYRTDDNLLTVGNVSVTGNITGGNLTVGSGTVNGGNFNGANFNGNVAFGTGTVGGSGNITGGNISAIGNISGGNLSLSGNITSDIGFTGATITINNAPGGVEGAEIRWALPSAANTVLNTSLIQDVFQNGMRFFEAGGNNRGLYMDLGNVPNGSGTAVGYRDIPQVSFTGNATLAATDAGRHYYSTLATANTLTIANNTSVSWSVGTAITVVNRGSGNITIAQGTGVSLYLAGNSTAANRTVTTYGMATLLNVAANVWMINGTGLT